MQQESLEGLKLRSAGFTLLDLLNGVGIGASDREALVRRVWDSLDAIGELDVATRLLELDVLDDDQVVTVIGVLLQELVASIGHLRPLTVRLRHMTEIEKLSGGAASTTVLENRLQVGG